VSYLQEEVIKAVSIIKTIIANNLLGKKLDRVHCRYTC